MTSEIATIHDKIKLAINFDGARTLEDVGRDLQSIAEEYPKAYALCESAYNKAHAIEEQRNIAVAVAGGYAAEAAKSAEQLEELATAVINADRHNSLVDDLIEDVQMEIAEEQKSADEERAYEEARDNVRGELVAFCERHLNLNGYHARDFVSILMGTLPHSSGLSPNALAELGVCIEQLFEGEA